MARGVALVALAMLTCASALPPVYQRKKLRETPISIQHDLDGLGAELQHLEKEARKAGLEI